MESMRKQQKSLTNCRDLAEKRLDLESGFGEEKHTLPKMGFGGRKTRILPTIGIGKKVYKRICLLKRF